MRVGIVSNEFLAPELTRIGGFGWAATHAAEALAAAGDEPVFVCPEAESLRVDCPAIGTTRLIARQGVVSFAREFRAARVDGLLSIEYRPSYDAALKALARTP